MRRVGEAVDARALGPHDHVCWPFIDRSEFRARLAEFVADGTARGLRVLYAGHGAPGTLGQDLGAVAGLDGLIERGDLELTSLGELYNADVPLDPHETLQGFAQATADAIKAGFAGLRVAADATMLVQSPGQLAAFVEWEHLADRFMVAEPFSGMCGFDARRLSAQAVTTLARLHPSAPPGYGEFRIYASATAADVALAGELDATTNEAFAGSLESIRSAMSLGASEFVVDGTDLGFVDHRALMTIRDFATRSGLRAVLRTNSSVPGRLIDILELQGIRIEPLARAGAAA